MIRQIISFLTLWAVLAFSSLPSVEMCYVPIRMALPEDPALKEACIAIGKGSRKAPHLTLVFMQIARDEYNPLLEIVFSMIDEDEEFVQLAKTIRLKFQNYSLLGPFLISNYAPIDIDGNINKRKFNQYEKFVYCLRNKIRDAAMKRFNEDCTFKTKVISRCEIIEVCEVENQVFYAMDVRRPMPHVTLKAKASEDDLSLVNELLQKKPKRSPGDITISLDNLKSSRTKITIW